MSVKVEAYYFIQNLRHLLLHGADGNVVPRADLLTTDGDLTGLCFINYIKTLIKNLQTINT